MGGRGDPYIVDIGCLRADPRRKTKGETGNLVESQAIVRRAGRLKIGAALEQPEGDRELPPAFYIIVDAVIPAFGAVAIQDRIAVIEQVDLHLSARIAAIEGEVKLAKVRPVIARPVDAIIEDVGKAAPTAV